MEQKNKTNEIFTHEVKPIPPVKFFFMGLGESALKLLKWVLDLLITIVTSLGAFFLMVGKGAVALVIGIFNFFKRKCHQFKYNDKWGRLSFILFGMGNLGHKQIVNGVMYLIFEIGYIVLFAIFGAPAVAGLQHLGTKTDQCIPDPLDDMFCNYQKGDNSIMILIYGLLWVVSLIFFLYFWNRSINAGYTNYRIINYKRFEKYDVDALEISERIDLEAREAFANGIKKGQFKKEKQQEIQSYIDGIKDKQQKDYTSYLLNGVIDHTYRYCKQLKVANAKIEKATDKLNKYVDSSSKGLESLLAKIENERSLLKQKGVSEDETKAFEEKAEERVEKYKNKVMLKTIDLKTKRQKREHLRDEINKRYSHYAEMQHTKNNDKYGKFNEFFKVVAEMDGELLFYQNYDKFVEVYNDSLDKAPAQNEENAKKIITLQEEYNQKVIETNTSFDGIIQRKAELKAEIAEVKAKYNARVKELKQQHPSDMDEQLLEAKADLVEHSTRLINALNDLPSDKNIKGMRKEEIQEAKHSLKRDRKYLKTNFTGETYAREAVINCMLVQYKIEYANAVYFTNILLDKKTGFLSKEQVQEKIQEIETRRENYRQEHTDNYVGRPKSFREQMGGLLNENFHITLLALPVLGIFLMSILPLIFSILVAFTNYSKGHQPPTQLFTWVGMQNFSFLFNPPADSIYKDMPATLGLTLSWTLIWAVAATFSNYILGIIVALMINKESIKLKKLWRTVFVMTIAVPQFISLLSMRALLQTGGAMDELWRSLFHQTLGFAENGHVTMTKIIIIVVNIWIGIPYTILSTTGILLNIPKDLYESARVDGAGTVKQFTKITMPYILFVTGPYLITQFVGNINNFNVIYFLSNGGPKMIGNPLSVGHTDLMITFLYSLITNESNPQFGIASTVGIVIFIVCSFFSIIMYNRSGAIKEEDQFQ